MYVLNSLYAKFEANQSNSKGATKLYISTSQEGANVHSLTG